MVTHRRGCCPFSFPFLFSLVAIAIVAVGCGCVVVNEGTPTSPLGVATWSTYVWAVGRHTTLL